MKSHFIIVFNKGVERKFETTDLPIRLGTDSASELILPGPANNVFALIDLLDGQPIIQPTNTIKGDLLLNDEILDSARKLISGDEVNFYGSKVLFSFVDEVLNIRVELEESRYITQPPSLDISAEFESPIVAKSFSRTSNNPSQDKATKILSWQSGVVISLILLGLISMIIFTSKSIQVEVLPDGADEVLIEGGWFQLPIGNRILLRRGFYTVYVKKTGYFDVSHEIEVTEEESQSFSIQMRKLPGYLSIAVNSSSDAQIIVDDNYIGQSFLGPIELESGIHFIDITADRFLPYYKKLIVPGLGKNQYLDVQLIPKWADVELTSNPSGAKIYSDFNYIGETPMLIELLEGSHSLSLIKAGYKPYDFSISTEANIKQILPTFDLEPANASLKVLSVPKGANVMVDGRYRGQSPITLDLSPDVDYSINLSKAGYGETSRNIRLSSGIFKEISVDLTARTGELVIETFPEDASIFIDGEVQGEGIVKLQLPAAPHRLDVRRDGYLPQEREIIPRPSYPQKITIRLISEAEMAQQSILQVIRNSQRQELRRIASGSFMMGTSRSERDRQANEVIVPVTITRPYFIGIKEVTNREFRKFRPNHDSGSSIHLSLVGDQNPVANVTWADAVEYLNWLSIQEGLLPAYEKVFERWQIIEPITNGYRLPTEAEWAWAIRYQAKPRSYVYPWTSDRFPPNKDSGNWAGKSALSLVKTLIPGWDDGFASTAPVGSFKPNSIGIFDGGGNVAEWVQDYYHIPTPGQIEPVIDPIGPKKGSSRVIRGSSWGHAGRRELRSGYRAFGNNAYWDVGFRIARNVE